MNQLLLRRHNETVLKDLEEGDLIELPRGFFSHWGVYVGEEKIVHLTKDGISSGFGSFSSENCSNNDRGCVKMESFWSVAKDSMAKKNNHYDTSFRPLPKEEIKRRAIGKIGHYTYNFVLGNCEHFAFWCRNNRNWSEQVETGLKWFTVAGALVVVLGFVFGGSENKKN